MKDIQRLIESQDAQSVVDSISMDEAENSTESRIAKKLENELGRLVDTSKIGKLDFKKADQTVKLFDKSLSLKDAGLLAPMFKEITASGILYYGLGDKGGEMVKVVVEFKYKHSGGGSNGYTVLYQTGDGGNTWE